MDIIIYNILIAISVTLVGYIFGSIPNGIWIGKVFFHKDPRDYGSGNSGGTNVGRVFGKKVGLIVIILDAAKAIIPLYMIWLFMVKVPLYNNLPLLPDMVTKYCGGDTTNYLVQWPVYWLSFVGATFGHCYPIFYKFNGGKNVSVFYGTATAAGWLFGIVPGLFFFVVLKLKKWVSLASVSCAWFSVLLSWIWAILLMTGVVNGTNAWLASYGPALECNYVFAIVMTIGAVILTIKHRANFERIKAGTESKIKWMK
jgi:glycerol-3-phosphate acyltransferase PlsY